MASASGSASCGWWWSVMMRSSPLGRPPGLVHAGDAAVHRDHQRAPALSATRGPGGSPLTPLWSGAGCTSPPGRPACPGPRPAGPCWSARPRRSRRRRRWSPRATAPRILRAAVSTPLSERGGWSRCKPASRKAATSSGRGNAPACEQPRDPGIASSFGEKARVAPERALVPALSQVRQGSIQRSVIHEIRVILHPRSMLSGRRLRLVRRKGAAPGGLLRLFAPSLRRRGGHGRLHRRERRLACSSSLTRASWALRSSSRAR